MIYFLEKEMRKYFWNMFSQTLTRKEYWIGFLGFVIYGFIIGTIIGTINVFINMNNDELLYTIMFTVYLPLLWPSIVMGVKRIADTGLSRYWYFITVIPYIGILFGLIFALIPSNYFKQKI